jgi:hypothetical protein
MENINDFHNSSELEGVHSVVDLTSIISIALPEDKEVLVIEVHQT